MCGSKLALGDLFLWFFHLWLLLGQRILTGLVPPFCDLGDHFVSLGTFEGTEGPTEGHMEAQNRIFTDFE